MVSMPVCVCVCVCVCVHVHVLRIVSMDKILCFIYTLIIIIFMSDCPIDCFMTEFQQSHMGNFGSCCKFRKISSMFEFQNEFIVGL